MVLREPFESHSIALGEETTNLLRTSRMGDSGRNATRFLGGAALGADAIPPEFVCPDHLWGHKPIYMLGGRHQPVASVLLESRLTSAVGPVSLVDGRRRMCQWLPFQLTRASCPGCSCTSFSSQSRRSRVFWSAAAVGSSCGRSRPSSFSPPSCCFRRSPASISTAVRSPGSP